VRELEVSEDLVVERLAIKQEKLLGDIRPLIQSIVDGVQTLQSRSRCMHTC
jgi:hypothetical protein